MAVKVQDMLQFLRGENCPVRICGDTDAAADGFCSIRQPRSNCLTWIKHAAEASLRSFDGLHNCIIVSSAVVPNRVSNVCFLLTDEPKTVFFSLLKCFWSTPMERRAARSANVLGNIGDNVAVGENSYISAESTVGAGTVIEHNVSLLNKVTIGSNCIIHSGAVIGTDGFGYYLDRNGKPQKVEHFGGVLIGDNVEIGANACIDRGTIDDTVIEDNVKIDNLVHIAHNVVLERDAMIVAGAIVCGSAKVCEKGYVAPGGIIKNQLKIGANAFVGLGAVVTRSVDAETVVAGVPAKSIRKVKEGDKS